MIALSLETVCVVGGALVGLIFAQGARGFYARMVESRKKVVTMSAKPPNVRTFDKGGEEEDAEGDDDNGDCELYYYEPSDSDDDGDRGEKEVTWAAGSAPSSSSSIPFHRTVSMARLPSPLPSPKGKKPLEPSVPETPPVSPETPKP